MREGQLPAGSEMEKGFGNRVGMGVAGTAPDGTAAGQTLWAPRVAPERPRDARVRTDAH